MIFTIEEASFRLGTLQLTGLPAALAQVGTAAAVFALFWAVSLFLKHVLFPRLEAVTELRPLKAAHIVLHGFSAPLTTFAWNFGLYAALSMLPWAPDCAGTVRSFLTLLFRLAGILLIARGLWRSAPLCTLLLGSAASRLDLQTNKTLYSILDKAYKVLVAAFCGITILDQLGYPVTGLITGVGLAGLTVSLAAQDSASNLFSGLMILLEHPFDIGDWITVGDVEGAVEDLTFRSTKVRALDNSLYVLPNASVASATINNATNRTKRMYRFTLGVTYGTTRAQLEALMADLAEMLRTRPETQTDSVIVRLTGFGDSSIDILVSCYVLTADLGRFLEIPNSLNLDLMDMMQKHGVEFAFPSTSVYIEKKA